MRIIAVRKVVCITQAWRQLQTKKVEEAIISERQLLDGSRRKRMYGTINIQK